MTMGAKRVLIVDDALIMRKRIKEIAEEAGWQVAGEAENGEEAVSLYQQERPDLVTLDIVMPKMDGVSALKQMIRNDPHARVVMISAVNQKKSWPNAFKPARSTLSSNHLTRPACAASSKSTSPLKA